MKFFEGGPKPRANIDAERHLGEALTEQDRLTRELRYSQARNELLTPLFRDAARLEITLELQGKKLERTRREANEADEVADHHHALEKLHKDRADLRGEPYTPQPGPPADNADLAAAASHQAAKTQLDIVLAEIKDRSEALRSQLGLPTE